MSLVNSIVQFLPEVKKPETRRLGFSEKLKWTLIVLVGFFILSVIPLYGLGENALAQFEQLSIILGASFGSILSLGIGPIVTASIVLQLLVGSGIININTKTHEGRAFYQGLQKISSIFFIIFEAFIYVFAGGLAPLESLQGSSQYFLLELGLVLQLIIGGILVMFMDEVTNKWGFGSGISLFIAAGVSSELVVRLISPLNSLGDFAFGSGYAPIGTIWVFFVSLISGAPREALIAFVAILSTAIVFIMAVYAQSMKVEIPLSFGNVRGYGMRWPLNFLYTSNMPVILVAALMANIQLFARLLENWGIPILGTFSGATPISGLVRWIATPNFMQDLLTGSLGLFNIGQAFVYTLFLAMGAVIFSLLWVQTSGMDAGSVAKQIISSGLQIPGFRRDERILEHLLQRYIIPLTVMGGIAVGLLAAAADLLGALAGGTGILLTVMILYRMYEDIAKQHLMEMNPAMRKIMGGGN